MMAFQFYSIFKTIIKDEEALEETIPLLLKGIFGLFLTLGTSFTAPMAA